MRRQLHFVWLAVAVLFCPVSQLSGQTFDSVTFENVSPDVVGSGDFRSYVLQNGGNARSLRYSGTITEIDTATYVSEVTMEVFGSGFNLANQILDQVTSFDGTFDFSGFISTETIVDAGDTWSFIFRENLDDSNDGLADASLDITFDFSTEPVPEPTVSDLGVFNLNQGVYPRQNQAGTEFPYRVVPIEVDADGDYTLRVDWQDAANAGSSFDGYLYLLDSPFAGTDSTAFTSNDDFIDTSTSLLTTPLEAGTTYYALLTTFSPSPIVPSFEANFSISTFNGGTARVVGIPEPGGLLVIGCFALAMTGRSRSAGSSC